MIPFLAGVTHGTNLNPIVKSIRDNILMDEAEQLVYQKKENKEIFKTHQRDSSTKYPDTFTNNV